MSLMDGVKIDIGLNASPFSNGIGSLKHEVSTFEDTIKRVGRTIAGVFGVVGVGATMRQSLQAWNEQEWATKKLEVATARWAQGNKGVMSSIQGLAKEMQRMTGIGDEVWESTGALGLNMGITASKIKDATKAAGILSLVFGYDTNTAMRNLAKTTAGVSGELGEMLPFLRELTTEQLKNGDVIDVIIEKYGDYAEMLSGTSKIATDRFKAAVGDVMEVLGQRLAPIVQKAATWMENFSESVEKNGSILGALKEKLRETWDGMGTLGKAVVGLSGTFLVLKTAGTAWTLFTKVVHASKDIFTNVFRAITSWPVIIAGAAFMLYVAWEKNWFGIRDVVLEAWASMKAGWSGAWDNLKSIWKDPDLSFFDKAMGSLGLVVRQTVNGLVAGWVDTYATFRDVWTDPDISFWEKFVTTISKSVKDTTTGLVNGWKEAYDSYDAIWNDSNISVVEKFATSIGQVARDIVDGIKLGWDDTYNTFSDIWGDKSLSVVEQFSATVLKFTRDTWDGLKEGWAGSYKDFSQIWGEANLSFWEKSMATISAGIKRIWEGGEGTPGLFSVFSDAWNNLTTIWNDPNLSFWNKVWETLLQGPHLLFDAIQSVGANLVAFFGGDSQKFLDTTNSALEGIKAKLKEIQEADSIGKKIEISINAIWSGITWVGEQIWNLDLVQMVRNDIERAMFGGRSGADIFDETGSLGAAKIKMNINLGDIIVNAFGVIGNAIWSGLTWFAEGPLHSFANWVRKQLGISETNEIKADLGSDLKVIFTGAFQGAQWLADWLIEGLNWASGQLNKVAGVMSKALSSAVLSEEESTLWTSIEAFGKTVGAAITSGIRFSISLAEVIKNAIEGAITALTGSETLGMLASNAIPLYFAVKATGLDKFAQSISQTMILAGLVKGGGTGNLFMAGLAGGAWSIAITLAIDKITKGIASGDIRQTVIDMMKAAGLGLLTTAVAGPLAGALVFTATLYIEPIMGVIKQAWNDWVSQQDPLWQQILGGSFYYLPEEAFTDPEKFINSLKNQSNSGADEDDKSGVRLPFPGLKMNRRFTGLEGMYAMEGFPSSGIEIIASPLTLDIRKEIDAVLKKAVAFVDQQQQTSPIEKLKEILSTPGDSQKALAGISVDPTNVIAPLIEKISMDLINGLNMGMIDPLVIAAIAYAENKMGIWATEGAGKGPFQWEYAAFEDISTRWMRDTIPSTMTHTEAATEPTYAIMGSEYYLDWIKNYGEGALGSLVGALVGWNKGRSSAQDWVAEGSNIEDLQDSTKILMTNFMVGMEKFVEGDWAKLSSELFDEILEVAGVVNAIIEQYPDVVKKSFPGEIPYTFDLIDEPVESVQNIAASLDLSPVLKGLEDIKDAILSKELSVTINESTLDLSPVTAAIDSATRGLLTLNNTASLVFSRLGTIRDHLWAIRGGGEKGYSTGGYTGESVPETQVAGVVHGGEWVAPAWMLENPFYAPIITALEQSRKGYPSGISKIAELKEKLQGFQTGGYVSGFKTSLNIPEAVKPGEINFFQDIADVFMDTVGKLIGVVEGLIDKVIPKTDPGTDYMDKFYEDLQRLGIRTENTGDKFEMLWKSLIKFNETLAKSSELFEFDEATGALKTSDMLGAFIKALPKFVSPHTPDVIGNARIGRTTEATWVPPDIDSVLNFVSSFGLALGSAILQIEGLQKVLNPFSTVIGGIVTVLEPMLMGLQPLGALFESLGYLIGGVLIPVLKPWIDQIGYASLALGWFVDWLVLQIDTLYSWLDSLPFLGSFFDPLLTEEQRQEKSKSLAERFEEYGEKTTPLQSTQGEVFQAGSSQHITYNNSFDIHDNNMISPDSEIVRSLGDMIIENLRNRGMAIVVGEPA